VFQDFDQGVVGNAVTSAVQQLPYSPSKMTWVIKNASDFPGGPEDLANHVHQQHVWFAVSGECVSALLETVMNLTPIKQ
jgi:hypothetical protein